MTFLQYLLILRRRWRWVGVTASAILTVAVAYAFLATPVYESSVRLFVSANGGSSDLDAISKGGSFAQQRVPSYSEVIASPRVLDPVIRKLGLTTTSADLLPHVNVSVPGQTVLIDVVVTDESPLRARDIANAIASQFPIVVNDLESTTGKETNVPQVKVSTIRPAVAGQAPISPKVGLTILLGLLLGLSAGCFVGILRDVLDRTISDPDVVTELVGCAALGLIGEDPEANTSQLTLGDNFSARAEAFRHLRTNIGFLSVDHEVRSIVVTGSVPGEGKSTTAANLALAMAQNGEATVIIDSDLRRPTLHNVFGLSAGVGLTTVLKGAVEVEQALQTWSPDLPLRVLTAGPIPPNPSELIGSARMAAVIKALTDQGYFVVIDSPPLLPVTDAAVLGRATDGAVVVTRVGSTHVEQLELAVKTLRQAGATVLGLVFNRVPRRGNSAYSYAAGSSYSSRPPSGGRQQGSGQAAGLDLASSGTPFSSTLAQNVAAAAEPARPNGYQVLQPSAVSQHETPHSPNGSYTAAPSAPTTASAASMHGVIELDQVATAGWPAGIDHNPFASNGFSGAEGYPLNGHHPANGQPANGHHATNGHPANGHHATNGHPANGHHATNGYQPNGGHSSANGQPVPVEHGQAPFEPSVADLFGGVPVIEPQGRRGRRAEDDGRQNGHGSSWRRS